MQEDAAWANELYLYWYDETFTRKGTLAIDFYQPGTRYNWYSSDTHYASGKVYYFGWGTEYRGTPLTNIISVFGFLDISSGEMSISNSCHDKKYSSNIDGAMPNSATDIS